MSAERLFAYTYGILAQPSYVERFWDELEQPPPHVPITKDPELFQRVADHGARLLYLHTYGSRFATMGDDGTVPQGAALCTAGSFSFQGLAKPRMAKAWPGVQPMRRIAAAMLVSPPLRSSPKTTLRNAAIT